MSKSLFMLAVCAVVAIGGVAWAADDPTTEPSLSPGEAGVVATTDAFYPFVVNSNNPAGHNGGRHSSAVALKNGNFALMTADGTNYSIVILDPMGTVVAGPNSIFHDKNGPVPHDGDVGAGGGDPFLAISPDGSELAIAGEISADPANFQTTLYPNDPGTVIVQRMNANDASPIGAAFVIFPMAVTAPTPAEDNFGSRSLCYTANGNLLLLVRSRDQWSSALRESFDPPNRVESQRVGTMTVVNGDGTQVVAAPKYIGRQYGYDLLANPNQWNAETGRSALTSPTGAVIYLGGSHGWVSLDNNGNEISEWRDYMTAADQKIAGDGNQGALLSNGGGDLTGRTSANVTPHSVVVYSISSGERVMSVPTSSWEFQMGGRSYGAMNPQGDTFMVWHETGIYELETAVGRFASADGELNDNQFILLEAGTEDGGLFLHQRGQAAFSNAHALYVSNDAARPGGPGGDDNEVVVRIYENPFGVTGIDTWDLY